MVQTTSKIGVRVPQTSPGCAFCRGPQNGVPFDFPFKPQKARTLKKTPTHIYPKIKHVQFFWYFFASNVADFTVNGTKDTGNLARRTLLANFFSAPHRPAAARKARQPRTESKIWVGKSGTYISRMWFPFGFTTIVQLSKYKKVPLLEGE